MSATGSWPLASRCQMALRPRLTQLLDEAGKPPSEEIGVELIQARNEHVL